MYLLYIIYNKIYIHLFILLSILGYLSFYPCSFLQVNCCLLFTIYSFICIIYV